MKKRHENEKVIDFGDGIRITFSRIPSQTFKMGASPIKDSSFVSSGLLISVSVLILILWTIRIYRRCLTQATRFQYYVSDLLIYCVLGCILIFGIVNFCKSKIQQNDIVELRSASKLDEAPRHTVYCSEFYISTTLISQFQFEKLLGSNPSIYIGKDLPVHNVNWQSAANFCEKLSSRSEYDCSLPSEAQYECACRGGSETIFFWGNDLSQINTYACCESQTPCEIGKRLPNKYGIYDIYGNVWEWCSDYYAQDYYRYSPSIDPIGPTVGARHVARGGSFKSSRHDCCSSRRLSYFPGFEDVDVGFRIIVKERAPKVSSGSRGQVTH